VTEDDDIPFEVHPLDRKRDPTSVTATAVILSVLTVAAMLAMYACTVFFS
jgi:hypothetical protein